MLSQDAVCHGRADLSRRVVMLPRWFLELQRRRPWMRLLEIENIVTLKLGHQGHVPVALNHQLKPRVELSSIKKLSPESHAAKQ